MKILSSEAQVFFTANEGTGSIKFKSVLKLRSIRGTPFSHEIDSRYPCVSLHRTAISQNFGLEVLVFNDFKDSFKK
jgi:hypothetical protein